MVVKETTHAENTTWHDRGIIGLIAQKPLKSFVAISSAPILLFRIILLIVEMLSVFTFRPVISLLSVVNSFLNSFFSMHSFQILNSSLLFAEPSYLHRTVNCHRGFGLRRA